mmetsp:Transcript_42938/g.52135  ORF Transcript_42938/g.52135 Transcript_42938/m.52135 type:complete len:195 (+) Transcript_42938:962-1546(+)
MPLKGKVKSQTLERALALRYLIHERKRYFQTKHKSCGIGRVLVLAERTTKGVGWNDNDIDDDDDNDESWLLRSEKVRLNDTNRRLKYLLERSAAALKRVLLIENEIAKCRADDRIQSLEDKIEKIERNREMDTATIRRTVKESVDIFLTRIVPTIFKLMPPSAWPIPLPLYCPSDTGRTIRVLVLAIPKDGRQI